VFLIGICGGPSCGKTTLVEYIKLSLGRSICVIKCSDFYKPLLGKDSKEPSSEFEEEIKDLHTQDGTDKALEKINKE
jgi:uridine kinase